MGGLYNVEENLVVIPIFTVFVVIPRPFLCCAVCMVPWMFFF